MTLDMDINKLNNILVKTRLDGNIIDPDMSILDIFRMAEREDNLYVQSSYVCCAYRTMYKDIPALIMVFSLELDTPVGSGAANEKIMKFVKFLEQTFTSNYGIRIVRYDSSNREKFYAMISIVIKEEDIRVR